MSLYAYTRQALYKCLETWQLLCKHTRADREHRTSVCAAASRHPGDLVRLPTAGKTEFVKSEPPLMRKNIDPYPAHRASQSENRSALGTKTATEQQGGAEYVCAHTNSREQSSPRAYALPRSLRRGVRLRLAGVCAHMCVYVCVF